MPTINHNWPSGQENDALINQSPQMGQQAMSETQDSDENMGADENIQNNNSV